MPIKICRFRKCKRSTLLPPLVRNPVSRNLPPATRKTSLDKKKGVKERKGRRRKRIDWKSAGELIKNPIVACLTLENAAGCGCTASWTEYLSSLFPAKQINATAV
jgi:hypothetical protein